MKCQPVNSMKGATVCTIRLRHQMDTKDVARDEPFDCAEDPEPWEADTDRPKEPPGTSETYLLL